jgi:hypothetical protein
MQICWVWIFLCNSTVMTVFYSVLFLLLCMSICKAPGGLRCKHAMSDLILPCEDIEWRFWLKNVTLEKKIMHFSYFLWKSKVIVILWNMTKQTYFSHFIYFFIIRYGIFHTREFRYKKIYNVKFCHNWCTMSDKVETDDK